MEASLRPTSVAPRLLSRLEEAWSAARASGALGPVSLEILRLHAAGFVSDSWRELPSGHFVDCGAGVGVPGILLALELPSVEWTLIDANEHRCELAERAVAAIGLSARVRVEHGVLEDYARRPATREHFDGATARLFGPAAELAECGLPLLRLGGDLVVSVSERTKQIWEDDRLLPLTGCEVQSAWRTPYGGYLAVQRMAPTPPRIPRRQAARRRAPLL